MRNIVFMLGLMSCASLQAQGVGSNNKIDLSGQWRFSQGDAPTYEDVVKLPGSMLTNGKGNDVCTHTQWTGSLYDSSFYSILIWRNIARRKCWQMGSIASREP